MGRTVLVIDDDKLIRKSLLEPLAKAGLQVDEAKDGKEGLDKALKTHPDLIVTDIRMPELDGLEMVERLRKDDWGKKVPIIILSTDETTSTINQALIDGVTIYLGKSTIDPEATADQIVAALQ